MQRSRASFGIWLTAVGALLGGILASWFAPTTISWYFKPGAPMGVDCVPSVQKAMHQLEITQAIGIVVGGAVGLLFYFAVARRRTPTRSEPTVNGP